MKPRMVKPCSTLNWTAHTTLVCSSGRMKRDMSEKGIGKPNRGEKGRLNQDEREGEWYQDERESEWSDTGRQSVRSRSTGGKKMVEWE